MQQKVDNICKKYLILVIYSMFFGKNNDIKKQHEHFIGTLIST
jgi:hypothetical protein